jgi:hypothetical protein
MEVSSMADEAMTGPPVTLDRDPVEGACPSCGAERLAAYPVNSEGGWFDVVKCQECLHPVSRERGPLLGPLHLLVDQL